MRQGPPTGPPAAKTPAEVPRARPGEVDVWALFGLEEGGPVPCGSARSLLYLAASPSTHRFEVVDFFVASRSAKVRLEGPMCEDYGRLVCSYRLTREEVGALTDDERRLLARTAALGVREGGPGRAKVRGLREALGLARAL